MNALNALSDLKFSLVISLLYFLHFIVQDIIIDIL